VTTRPRTRGERIADTRARLDGDVDVWVATADATTGRAHLIPLSFYWDGVSLFVATPVGSVTGRNLRATGRAQLGLGPTRDVIHIEAGVALLEADDVTDAFGDVFADRTGFEPRGLEGYGFFRMDPVRIRAWKEEDELAGRDIMRDGRWLDA
jgi:hypothetical protein